MTETQQTQDVFVETPTEYETDVDCKHPVTIYIGDPNPDAITHLCQQLSLFVEAHDEDALVRVMEVLSPAFKTAGQYAIETGTPPNVPASAWRPVELAVEDIDREAANEIVGALRELAAGGFDSPTLASRFAQALVDATDDQPRSVVRMIRDDSPRPMLEWHTDTDADLDSA